MEHSKKFFLVKEFYDNGAWRKAKVRNAVIKHWITADEFEEITGEQYSDE